MRPASPLLVALLLVCAAVAGCLDASDADTGPPPAPGDPLGTPQDPGWPALDAAPLRPGAKLFDALQAQLANGERYQCTVNFIFSDPNNTTLYVGTASHCLVGFRIGDPIALAEGAAWGTVAYCSHAVLEGTDECPSLGVTASEVGANDFGLIAIDADDRDQVHPATFRIGGPTHLAAPPVVGDAAYTYGNTDYRDGRIPTVPDHLDARAAVVDHVDAWVVEMVVDTTSLGGDSGSPVLAGDGGALGVMQYVLSSQCSGNRVDVNGAVLLRPALDFLHEKTSLRVDLKTWPLLDPPPSLPRPPGSCRGDAPGQPAPVAPGSAA